MRTQLMATTIVSVNLTPSAPGYATLWIESEKGEIGISSLREESARALVQAFNAALSLDCEAQVILDEIARVHGL